MVVNLVVLATQRGPIVDAFERAARVRGEELALCLAAQARDLQTEADGSERHHLLETFLAFEDVEGAAILSPDGKALAAVGDAGVPVGPAWPRGPGEVVVRRGEAGSDYLARVPGTDSLARIHLGDHTLSSTVGSIGKTIMVIAATAVGVGFLVAFAAASAFTRPIGLLADQARRISGGELGARIEMRRSDEIGELSAAMNAMSLSLADKDRGLREAKEVAESQNEELRRQGEELAGQTRNLETLVASIAEGVVFLNLDRRVVVANHAAERILGIPIGRLRGGLLEDLRFPEADARLPAILAEACERAARDDRYHSQIRLADHLHTVTTVHEEQGSAIGVLSVVQDLSKIRTLESEQKELLDQLYQQEKMAIVGLLAASLAHELNTPLGTILLQTQRVAESLHGSDDGEALEVVQGEVRRCRDIVGRLLDFSRVAKGHPEVQSLAGPLARCISLAESGLRAKGFSIRKSVAPGVPQVRVDANQIEQVLMNLIWNAADSMSEGGCIDIRLIGVGHGAELRVRDEGKGIPPDQLKQVFEPFFTTKPRGKGTGLGLAICKRIVEDHRGTIRIQSNSGSGTEVCLFLPAADGNHG